MRAKQRCLFGVDIWLQANESEIKTKETKKTREREQGRETIGTQETAFLILPVSLSIALTMFCPISSLGSFSLHTLSTHSHGWCCSSFYLPAIYLSFQLQHKLLQFLSWFSSNFSRLSLAHLDTAPDTLYPPSPLQA